MIAPLMLILFFLLSYDKQSKIISIPSVKDLLKVS